MKIGIVSFIDTQQNYGQLIQGFALQTYLRERYGADVFHLRYNSTAPNGSGIIKLIYKAYMAIRMAANGTLAAYLKDHQESIKPIKDLDFISMKSSFEKRGFDEFRKSFMCFSDNEYDAVSLNLNPPKADLWVAGSDQIWGAPSPIFHLSFVPKKSKRMSYAASMGHVQLNNKYRQIWFKKYLRKFDYVSLRETSGVEECRKIGIENAKLVPDPTFLLEPVRYREISIKPTFIEGKKYVFLYLLGNKIDIKVSQIYEWASRNGLEVIYVASQGREDIYKKYAATPQEWLSLIDNAETVITNSFHGMAMSIILNKKFLVFPLVGSWEGMNARITTTLDNFGISRNHIYSGKLDNALDVIDYLPINARISKARKEIDSDFDAIITN